MFWASAVVNVLISYAFFMWQAQPFSGDIWSLVELRNGLFLALVRSPFLRIVLPLSGFNVWVVASTALSLTCSLYHGILCVRARKVPVTDFAALLLAVLAIAGMLSYRSGVTLFDLAAVAGASKMCIRDRYYTIKRRALYGIIGMCRLRRHAIRFQRIASERRHACGIITALRILYHKKPMPAGMYMEMQLQNER